MKIRPAVNADKVEVLKFCVDTFEWGDYIGDAWDLWYSDQNGALLVAEYEERSIRIKKNLPVVGVSHASLLPGKRNVWLEGIRVNPKYRRRYVATELINKMVLYGKRQGAKEASAMVSKSKYCFSVNDGKERFLRRF